MKQALVFAGKCILAGLLLIIPVYLAIIVLLKGMQSTERLIHPLIHLLPEDLPAEQILSLLLVLTLCFLLGLAMRTTLGHRARVRLESTIIEKIPGYTLFRSLSHQLAGQDKDSIWKPALVEIHGSLAPAFIIEILDDSRFTIFVPSIPTPFAGATYVMDGARVHPVDIPLADAIKVISNWGSGTSRMLQAMEKSASIDTVAEAGRRQ
ncbi:DUF502 domain-containing protein [Ectopseudomonas khazarica]|uniref:DUF502 domain-containing protein n=1 Tax=Ectopseudomonas khazarica TaxID=2502979 RepID=UPI0037CC09B7